MTALFLLAALLLESGRSAKVTRMDVGGEGPGGDNRVLSVANCVDKSRMFSGLVTCVLHEGTYNEIIHLEGSVYNGIRIVAAEGEHVAVSGGMVIPTASWRKQGSVYQVNLTKLGLKDLGTINSNPPTLYFRGDRMLLAR